MVSMCEWRCFYSLHSADLKDSFRHKVTGTERYEQPFEPRGGILADEMGLGKTLSTLCVIISSLERSREFASQGSGKAVPTKTTLVVAPSLCKYCAVSYETPTRSLADFRKQVLLEDWVKEIQR